MGQQTKRKATWWQIPVSILFTAIILILLFQMIDWDNFFIVLNDLQLYMFIIVAATFIIALVLQGFKYWFFVRPDAPLNAAICAYGPGNFLTNMPAGIVIGPAIHIMLLRPWVSAVFSASTLFLDMFTKVITLFLFMLIGICVSTIALPVWMYVIVILATIFLIGLLILLVYPKTSDFLLHLTAKLNNTKIGHYTITKKIIEGIEQLCVSSRVFQTNHRMIWLHLFLGLFIEATLALPYLIIAKGINIDLPLQNWIWIHCAVRICCMLPLTVGGLGAREAALLLINRLLGIPSGQLIMLSLVYSVVFILATALGAAVLFLIHPRKSKKTVTQGSVSDELSGADFDIFN